MQCWIEGLQSNQTRERTTCAQLGPVMMAAAPVKKAGPPLLMISFGAQTFSVLMKPSLSLSF